MAINIDHQKDVISANSGIITVDQTGALVLPKGNTSERPSAPVEAMIRYNTDTTELEQYINGAWTSLARNSIGDLPDVDITSIQNGQVIKWDTATGKFLPADDEENLLNNDTNDLAEGTDNSVGESSPGAGDGTNNLYYTDARVDARIANAVLDDLSGVTITGTPGNNYVLTYVAATGQWEPRSVTAAQGGLTEGDAIAFAIALGG